MTQEEGGAKRSGLLVLAVLLAGVVPGVSGCYVQPPFDLTGTYNGYWEGPIYHQIGDDTLYQCPFSLVLRQDAWFFRLFGINVTGTASFDYTCFLEEDLAAWVNYNSLEVPIFGRTKHDGTITLFSGVCLSEDTVCLKVNLNGLGEDFNGDRRMDAYDGDMHFYLAFPDIEPIDVNMTFETLTSYWGFKEENGPAAPPAPSDTPPGSSPQLFEPPSR